MVKVGLALQQDINLNAGHLSTMFGDKGGFGLAANEPSFSPADKDFMAVFDRTEYSLGHITDNPIDIGNAHIKHSDGAINQLISKDHGYNVGDIAKEQNGHSDDNVALSNGRRKATVSTDANQNNKAKEKRKDVRLTLAIQEIEIQAASLRELQARIAELNEEITKIDVEIAAIDKQLAAVQEAQELLNDPELNANSPAGRAKRAEFKKLSIAGGADPDKLTKADGKIDIEAARAELDQMTLDLNQKQTENTAQKQALEEKLSQVKEKEHELLKSPQNQDKTDYETALASGDDPATIEQAKEAYGRTSEGIIQNHALERDSLESMDLSTNNITSLDFDDFNFDDFDFDSFNKLSDAPSIANIENAADIKIGNNKNQITPDNHISNAGERALGSFAANDDDYSTSVISNIFSMASSPDVKIPDVSQEQQMETRQAPTATSELNA